MSGSPRIIVALPSPTERVEVADWLSGERLEPVPVASSHAAMEAMRARPFDLLIADAVFAFQEGLHACGRARSPLTPTIVIGRETDEPKGDAVDGQTMYLARPVERSMLVCFVSMALLEGRPPRRSIRKPVSRVDIVVNGVPSRLVDVSNEGMRLELSSDRRTALPIYFKVRVPLMEVGVFVKRMWTRPSSSHAAMTWYGGALAENRPGAEQAWRSFVEMVPTIDQPDA